MFPYPTDLPKKEIQDVISTIATRSIATNTGNFAKDLWVITGYALSQVVGELPQTFGTAPSSDLSTEEAVAQLQQAIETSELPAGAVQAVPVNWKQVLLWALQLFAQLAA